MTNFLGIHLDGQSLKIAKLRQENKKISIKLLRTLASCDVLENVNPLYNLEIFQAKDHMIVSGLESCEIFLRTLHLKLGDKKQVLSALPFQLEGIFPFAIDESVITPYIFKEDDGSSKVHVYATKKKQIHTHLKALHNIGLDPDIISSVPMALSRYFSYVFPEEKQGVLFYFGSTSSTVLYFQKGKLEYTYPFYFGIDLLFEALGCDFKDLKPYEILEKAYTLDLIDIKPLDAPHTFEVLFSLQKELDRIVSYFQTKAQHSPTTSVAISGNFSIFSKFKDFFITSIPSHLTVLKTPPLGDFDEPTVESYAVTLGLCLDAAMKDGLSMQLRQKEFICPRSIKHRLQSLYKYYAGCAALCLCVGASFHLHLKHKEKVLKELCCRYFPDTTVRGPIQEEISLLEKKWSKEKLQDVVAPSIYSVSDVLAWLSSHPKLSKVQESQSPIECVDIRHVKYQMVKPPKLSSPTGSTLIKIELEFSSPSSRIAKDFHEALLKGDAIVDPKKEITWSVKDSLYKTSFYIRPKRIS